MKKTIFIVMNKRKIVLNKAGRNVV